MSSKNVFGILSSEKQLKLEELVKNNDEYHESTYEKLMRIREELIKSEDAYVPLPSGSIIYTAKLFTIATKENGKTLNRSAYKKCKYLNFTWKIYGTKDKHGERHPVPSAPIFVFNEHGFLGYPSHNDVDPLQTPTVLLDWTEMLNLAHISRTMNQRIG